MPGVSNLKALAYLAQVPLTMPDVPHPILGLIALVFVMAGLGFRVAAVPFHFYAPDVYQGSPTIIAALLAWVPKGIGFVAILRTLTAVIPTDVPPPGNNLTNQAAVLSWIIAAVTMTLGNTVALAQTNLKRLFAYSSIAHAGYLMIGVAVAFRNGPEHRRASTAGQRGRPVLPRHLRPDDPRRLRRDHRPEHARAAGRDGRRPRRPGADPPGHGPGDGDLPVQPGGHPAAGRVHRQVQPVRRRLRGLERHRRPDVPVARRDRRDQLGDRGVLLPQDRRRDVLPRPGRPAPEAPADLADGDGHRRLLDADGRSSASGPSRSTARLAGLGRGPDPAPRARSPSWPRSRPTTAATAEAELRRANEEAKASATRGLQWVPPARQPARP